MGKKMSPKTKKDSKRTVLVFRKQMQKIESRILNEHTLSREYQKRLARSKRFMNRGLRQVQVHGPNICCIRRFTSRGCQCLPVRECQRQGSAALCTNHASRAGPPVQRPSGGGSVRGFSFSTGTHLAIPGFVELAHQYAMELR